MIQEYIDHGFKLTPILPFSKSPHLKNWNLMENCLKSGADLPKGYGVGLCHAYSGTMSLDIDDVKRTFEDYPEILHIVLGQNNVFISSGMPNKTKLLFRCPVPYPTKKFSKFDPVQNKYNVLFELRCASRDGLSVQDILPNSIHPLTLKPYEWIGDWKNIPEIPQALVDLWSLDGEINVPDTEVLNSDFTPVNIEEVRNALLFISPSSGREEWISVGMALHHEGVSSDSLLKFFRMWDEWSRGCADKYPGTNALMSQWNSFKLDTVNPIRIGTLFSIASRYGWSSKVDVSKLFESVEPEAIGISQTHLGLMPHPPKLPIHLFPQVLRDHALTVSENVGCDPLVPLYAGLATLSGAADSRIRLQLTPGFKVPPILWLMTIGSPGDKKTPGAKPMFEPLKQIELQDRPGFKKRLLEWEAMESMHYATKKSFLQQASSEAGIFGNVQELISNVVELPPQPTPLRVLVTDITSQKLVRHASDQKRGLFCHLDEMSGWARKLTDKTSSEDRSAWVVSYEGDSYSMDRVQSGTTYCENLSVSIFGNIQPEVFKKHLHPLAVDGLIQRFLPCVLRSDYTKRGEYSATYNDSYLAWDSAVHCLYAIAPQDYELSQPAYKLFREFQNWYESMKQNERILATSNIFMTAFSKIEGLLGRLILIFHLTENPHSKTVSDDIVRRVIELTRYYIIPVLRFTFMDLSGSTSFDAWIVDYIIHQSHNKTVTLADIKRSGRRKIDSQNLYAQDQIVIGSMDVLEEMNWVKRLDDGSREHLHIAEWGINPQLSASFQSYKERVKMAKDQIRTVYKKDGDWGT